MTHERELRSQLGLSEEWLLTDVPWMTQELYDRTFIIAGEDNFRFVSGSSRTDREGNTHIRASVFFNDQARTNFREYLAE